MTAVLHTADNATCPLVDEPGNYHFEGHCEDCDVATLARLTLGQVEDRYHVGRISQDQYEAYMHVWALLSPHRGRPEWRDNPTDPAAQRIARKLRRRLEVSRP